MCPKYRESPPSTVLCPECGESTMRGSTVLCLEYEESTMRGSTVLCPGYGESTMREPYYEKFCSAASAYASVFFHIRHLSSAKSC